MNKTPDMQRIKRVHLIGIGGSGMCGIAEVLLNQGYQVSGSDIKESASTNHLRELGATIFIGHEAKNIENSGVVVTSTAIDKTNPEVKEALKLRLPILKRAQMLGELMRLQQGIAVSGTHGKTTTTSLVASVLTEGGLDPTYVIGGLLNSSGSNAKLGQGKYFIAEADESDASFLYLHPKMAIVTNIDADHMQTYQQDFATLEKTFLEFLHRLPFFGLAVVCADDPNVRKILPDIARPVITYGFNESADIRAVEFLQINTRSQFIVLRKNKNDLYVNLNLAGAHNVLNALAAIAIATECGVSDEAICSALQKFQGVGRRFQIHGEMIADFGKALVIEDYGHHPREIAVTMQAARNAWPNRRIVLAFQPHRYSRTRDLFEDFSDVLSDVDALLLLDVYPAGEQPISGADGRALARSIRQRGKIDPVFVSKTEELQQLLPNVLKNNDVLLLQGAGTIGSVAAKLVANKG